MCSTVSGVDLVEVARCTQKAYATGKWRDLPIHENHEPLVQVPVEYCHSFYALEMGLTDDTRIFLRKSVFEMFLLADTLVKKQDYGLIVYDGWRPVELQENLFWYYMKKFTVVKLHLEEQFTYAESSQEVKKIFLELPEGLQRKLKELNRVYVSWPSSDILCPSPHATGGAIDVWLYKDSQPVDLGVPFDWMQEEAGAFYHMRTVRNKFLYDDVVCNNRTLLQTAMVASGFSCYPNEIWHFNLGNQMDALVRGGYAFYSYIEP